VVREKYLLLQVAAGAEQNLLPSLERSLEFVFKSKIEGILFIHSAGRVSRIRPPSRRRQSVIEFCLQTDRPCSRPTEYQETIYEKIIPCLFAALRIFELNIQQRAVAHILEP
jgi:hypothetical protein